MSREQELFFHTEAFVLRNGSEKLYTFQCGATQINFSRSDNSLVSLSKSPFGSFHGDTSKPQEKEEVLDKVINWSRENSIVKLTITNPPAVYRQSITEDWEIFRRNRFEVNYRDVTQYFDLHQAEMKMNVHRKRRLRHCIKEGFIFRQLSLESLPDAYARICESRINKGYPITMTLQQLTKAFEQFPHHYRIYAVLDDQKIIATAVAIVVSSDILYCFYIGDAMAYRQYSPVTMLIYNIFTQARQEGFSILDLGISTDQGLLNEGLYSFKKSLGTADSDKLTFGRQL